MRYLAGAVLFAVAILFGIRSSVILMQMQDEVNRSLTPQEQIPDFCWGNRLIEAHEQQYPISDLRRKLYREWWGAAIAMVGALACVIPF